MRDVSDTLLKAAAVFLESPDLGPGDFTAPRLVALAFAAERERIAVWHETQASLLEKAVDKILSEGGVIEPSNKSVAELHRSFAAAIRAGAE